MAKILLVDDSKVVRKILTLDLESLGHYVHAADCGAAGIKAMDKEKFDLIISDLNMPDMDGLVMADIVASRYDTPILMLTTEDCSSELMGRAKTIGVKGWMVKPVESSVLRQSIDKVLGNSK